jgi:hypothetical protein
MDKGLLFMDRQRKWFLKIQSTLGEDALNNDERTSKGLEYYINTAA